MELYRQHEQTEYFIDDFAAPHFDAMTKEGLHRKAEIAEELGYRDMQIIELREQIEAMHNSWNKNQAKDQDLLHECSNENARLREQLAQAQSQSVRK